MCVKRRSSSSFIRSDQPDWWDAECEFRVTNDPEDLISYKDRKKVFKDIVTKTRSAYQNRERIKLLDFTGTKNVNTLWEKLKQGHCKQNNLNSNSTP